jgi:hypothetical protein
VHLSSNSIVAHKWPMSPTNLSFEKTEICPLWSEN